MARNQALLLGGLPGFDGRFVLDTGAQFSVVSPGYQERIQRSDAYRSATKLMFVNESGEMHLGGFRAAELTFGAFTLQNAMLRLADARASAEMFNGVDALLGVNLLRRYIWTLDQTAATLHAEPVAQPVQVGDYGAGVRLARREDGSVRVAGVQPGGPAQEAGVAPGQTLLAIDGHPLRGLPHDLAPDNRPVELALDVRDGLVRRTLRVTTRELI